MRLAEALAGGVFDGRVDEELVRVDDVVAEEVEQARGAAKGFAEGHLGMSVGARGQLDGDLVHAVTVAVQHEEALEEKRVSPRAHEVKESSRGTRSSR